MARVVRSESDLAFVRKARSESWRQSQYNFVYETLDRVKSRLNDAITLIGFAGSPWSVATYMIEGGPPHLSFNTKRLMAEHPEVFCELMEHITHVTKVYLKGQVAAGAEVIQIFESHAGLALSPQQYERFCLPYLKEILSELHGQVPMCLLCQWLCW